MLPRVLLVLLASPALASPVLAPRAGFFDSATVGSCVVRRVAVRAGAPWTMWYSARPDGFAADVVPIATGVVGVAVSEDGVRWERLAGDARGADEARVAQRGPERRVVEDNHELLSYPEWPFHEEAERAAAPLERRRPGLALRQAVRQTWAPECPGSARRRRRQQCSSGRRRPPGCEAPAAAAK